MQDRAGSGAFDHEEYIALGWKRQYMLRISEIDEEQLQEGELLHEGRASSGNDTPIGLIRNVPVVLDDWRTWIFSFFFTKHELGDHEDADLLYTRGRLRFNLAGKHGNRKKMDSEEGVEENARNVQGKKKSEPLPNKLSILKGCASQTSKNNEEELASTSSLRIYWKGAALDETIPIPAQA